MGIAWELMGLGYDPLEDIANQKENLNGWDKHYKGMGWSMDQKGGGKVKGYQCKICGGLCDPGELMGGVCADCRKEAEGSLAPRYRDHPRRCIAYDCGDGAEGQRPSAGGAVGDNGGCNDLRKGDDGMGARDQLANELMAVMGAYDVLPPT